MLWVAPAGRQEWQVEGNLYDRGGRLIYVELNGSCAAGPFNELLRSFGWPAAPLLFQFLREAAFVDEAEFRRVARCDG